MGWPREEILSAQGPPSPRRRGAPGETGSSLWGRGWGFPTARARPRPGCCVGAGTSGAGRSSARRSVNQNVEPTPGWLTPHLAAVRLHQIFHDRQPEAAAVLADRPPLGGAVEPLERPPLIVRRHPDAVILDLDPHLIADGRARTKSRRRPASS